MTDGKYYFEGTGKGSIAFIVPEKFIDYTISLGEYGETQAFFTQSKKSSLSANEQKKRNDEIFFNY